MLNMKKEKEALATALEENDIAKKLNEAIKKTEAAKNEENGEDMLDEFTPVKDGRSPGKRRGAVSCA